MYISRALNFHDFRDFSRIAKLNMRIFGIAHHHKKTYCIRKSTGKSAKLKCSLSSTSENREIKIL